MRAIGEVRKINTKRNLGWENVPLTVAGTPFEYPCYVIKRTKGTNQAKAFMERVDLRPATCFMEWVAPAPRRGRRQSPDSR
ncbi:hypothetical protein GCM10010307_05720 [Streptomyces vastus]|uniref:Uncharacterized protein n=1 Tax=Streptomyces vastus TaxID=285451 RepID=A0ABN3QBF8_9ACTN